MSERNSVGLEPIQVNIAETFWTDIMWWAWGSFKTETCIVSAE